MSTSQSLILILACAILDRLRLQCTLVYLTRRPPPFLWHSYSTTTVKMKKKKEKEKERKNTKENKNNKQNKILQKGKNKKQIKICAKMWYGTHGPPKYISYSFFSLIPLFLGSYDMAPPLVDAILFSRRAYVFKLRSKTRACVTDVDT